MAIKYTVTHEIVEDLIAKVRRTPLDQILITPKVILFTDLTTLNWLFERLQ